jgi:ankyrin repeat protein
MADEHHNIREELLNKKMRTAVWYQYYLALTKEQQTNLSFEDYLQQVSYVYHENRQQNAPLNQASYKKGHVYNMEKLLEFYPEININFQNTEIMKTALHWAVQNNHREAVKFLLDRGASKTVIDSFGKKPVQYCDACAHAIQQLLNPSQQVQAETTSTATTSFSNG